MVNFLLHFAHHVFSAVFVLYAGYRYGWTAWEVGAMSAAATSAIEAMLSRITESCGARWSSSSSLSDAGS